MEIGHYMAPPWNLACAFSPSVAPYLADRIAERGGTSQFRPLSGRLVSELYCCLRFTMPRPSRPMPRTARLAGSGTRPGSDVALRLADQDPVGSAVQVPAEPTHEPCPDHRPKKVVSSKPAALTTPRMSNTSESLKSSGPPLSAVRTILDTDCKVKVKTTPAVIV